MLRREGWWWDVEGGEALQPRLIPPPQSWNGSFHFWSSLFLLLLCFAFTSIANYACQIFLDDGVRGNGSGVLGNG